MGRRGPTPQPTHLKLLRGNPGHRPLNRNEPLPALPPEPPEAPVELTGYARLEWDRVIPELYRLRIVTNGDIRALAAYCEAYRRWRTAVETLAEMEARDPTMRGQIVKTQSGGAAPNPILQIADKAARDLVRFASEFGLSALARSRISAGPTPQSDKFRGLLALDAG
jgi:P27 family predicted phage terminase small subunit